MLVDLFDVSLDESENHILQAILNLIDFESKRMLIQEVNSNVEIDLPMYKAPPKSKACFGSQGILKKESMVEQE